MALFDHHEVIQMLYIRVLREQTSPDKCRN